jgi:hypothetical protein
MCYILEGREMQTGLCWGNLKDKGHLEDLGIHRRMMLKEILKKQNRRVSTG